MHKTIAFATVVQMELETMKTEGLHLSGTPWYHIKTSASFSGLNAESEKAEVWLISVLYSSKNRS